MPVHNGERHLREAIESILGQSFGTFEFIIVDDGSTDAGPSILDEYSREDPRVRVSTLPQQVGVARSQRWDRARDGRADRQDGRGRRCAP